MKKFEYPTEEGGIEVAQHLGVHPDEIFASEQDWEYIYPRVEDLNLYLKIYKEKEVSDLAKRVLGCFIFQALDNHLCKKGNPEVVTESLDLLYKDINIHRTEFLYWSLREDPYYDNHMEDAWYVTPYVRKYI